MLDYLKLFDDQEAFFESYSDEEVGRLFRAMMAYAFRGEAPDFAGPERYIWTVLRRHIDQCDAKQSAQEENGRKGGRPRKDSPESKTQQNPRKPNETQENPAKPKETPQEQEQEHTQEQYEEEDGGARARVIFAPAPESAPAPASPSMGQVIAFDGSDLTRDIQTNRRAAQLVARYLPQGKTPLEGDFRVGEIAGDIAAYGEARVESALREAALSDKRGGVDLKFYRLKLRDAGKPKAARAAPADFQRRTYSADDFRGMEIDLDSAMG